MILTKTMYKSNFYDILKGVGSWKVSTCVQEGEILSALSQVPRLTYMLLKLINSIVKYPEKVKKVKSFDFKHALMYTLDKGSNYLKYGHNVFETNKENTPILGQETADHSKERDANDMSFTQCVDRSHVEGMKNNSVSLLPTEKVVSPSDIDLTDDLMAEVCDLAWHICDTQLRQMLATGRVQFYYFGTEWCEYRPQGYNVFMKYVKYILQK